MTLVLAKQVLQAARNKGSMIATAESCTGGMVAAALTDIPGSSDVFDRGFVTYSYPAKTAMLDVSEEMLAQYGAVSEPVALQMALGALAHSNATYTVAITGVAGPGASGAKPEGLVHFAAASRFGPRITTVQEFGALGRDHVRRAATGFALSLLLEIIEKNAQ